MIPPPGLKLYQRINAYRIDSKLRELVEIKMMPPFDERDVIFNNIPEDSLTRVQATGVLRVGYNADARPFVFFNQMGELVGYDVAMIYELAKDLKATVQFVPFSWDYLTRDMTENKFDVAISGLYVTAQRIQFASFTEPYLRFSPALVVPKSHKNEFESITAIRKMKSLRLGISEGPELVDLANKYIPDATLVVVDNYNAMLADYFAEGRIDAALWDISGGQMWTLGHPDYVTLIPAGIGAPLLMGYMVQKNSPQFLNFLNYWLELKENDGFKKRLYNKWILGREPEEESKRWSILNNLIRRSAKKEE